MKYMGSKRAMLSNGLGDAIDHAVETANTVYDLFTGSGVVACHIAERYEKRVVASDLQLFATVLAGSIIQRTGPISKPNWQDQWVTRAHKRLKSYGSWEQVEKHQAELDQNRPDSFANLGIELAMEATDFPLTGAYGGYYFSPWQSMWLDALRGTLPRDQAVKMVALASLIRAASRCAASPGHTAQPFKANATAGPFLIEAWKRPLPQLVLSEAGTLSKRHAKIAGEAICSDAMIVSQQISEGDLVFLDPPYSGVHYSRFYHVLESVAQGKLGPVSGTGRYPPSEDRPWSEFSVITKSRQAFDSLLRSLADKGASAIITFPAGNASNGLSGEQVKELASSHFSIQEEKVSSRFSTLGGDSKHRAARQDAQELILTLGPR
ncbi:DNA adenine methylase [Rhizobium tumorigenes]|uniref:DNA adenine methylase n=1 Tax=Rhizobium tumorigenes TaxID=2041385 RepID=UPI00241CFD4B|nr:DNA adenine methylase [Rhizobium tumorigenes]WFS03107.1 DNA adenine methylase [Rhizobium tumorigenes]